MPCNEQETVSDRRRIGDIEVHLRTVGVRQDVGDSVAADLVRRYNSAYIKRLCKSELVP
jgi:hypothetical protein